VILIAVALLVASAIAVIGFARALGRHERRLERLAERIATLETDGTSTLTIEGEADGIPRPSQLLN
jgi:hypothetical protein